MPERLPDAILVPLTLLLSAAMWCGIVLVLATVGGWRELARRFPAHGVPAAATGFFMQSGKVGRVSYGSCLTIYTSPWGLYLSVIFPFRLFHPPLFIPWPAIHSPVVRRFLWSKWVRAEVGARPITMLELSHRVLPLPGVPGARGA